MRLTKFLTFSVLFNHSLFIRIFNCQEQVFECDFDTDTCGGISLSLSRAENKICFDPFYYRLTDYSSTGNYISKIILLYLIYLHII